MDGYRMMLIREWDRVRLISRGGFDWTRHFPLIVEGVLKLRRKHFAIDGEVVVLDKDGVSDFDGLHSRKHYSASYGGGFSGGFGLGLPHREEFHHRL
jgi:bifunctional non-homologous end joining protein LigD